MLLAARALAQPWGLACSTAAEIIERTGAGRSRAYELRDELLRQLPELQRPVGRPAAPPSPPLAAEVRAELTSQMLRYVRTHPGCISGAGQRQRYDDGLRLFVIELREKHADVPLGDFAHAVQIPVDTLADWLRPAAPPPRPAPPPDPPATLHPTIARVETLLEAWGRWHGSFTDFCVHVRQHLRIPWGVTVIGRILDEHGVRKQRRRPGRSPDEKALRDQFETFFAGAQWVGDGSPIVVTVGEERFAFNFELMVDAHTAAFTGFDIRAHEDAAAVIAAFDDGVQNSGAAPLALLLDNRSSNHTAEVEQTLGDTLLIPATKARPQNKAHVEGAYGLFQQQVPPLVVHTDSPASLARDVLSLVAWTWARTLNHKPRDDRGGLSRVQLYGEETPTPEQIARARAALLERLNKQRLADQTRRARLDPATRRILDEAFERLGFDDPDRNIRDAIAIFPHDAVLEAIATYDGKRNAGTLPHDAGPRYLLAIARNITAEDEGMHIAEQLWRARLAARDHSIEQLDTARRRSADLLGDDHIALLIDHVDRALATDRRLDRFFWLRAATDVIAARPTDLHTNLFRTAARRIHATHRVPHRQRLAATRFLAAKLRPIA